MSTERVLKITLSYDGTAYVGWQRQAGGVSIQGLLEDALARLEGALVVVHGAGRTDAGVHAFGQVASARVSTPHDAAVIRRALNGMLPPDVRVLGVEDAAVDFHARYSASGKTYEYRIWQGEVQPPSRGRGAGTCRETWTSRRWTARRASWRGGTILPRSSRPAVAWRPRRAR